MKVELRQRPPYQVNLNNRRLKGARRSALVTVHSVKVMLVPMCSANAPGELYVVQTRHCIHTCMSVYKVGRARDAGLRMQQYPKGSRLIARLPVSHMCDAERVLLSMCRVHFVQRKDFGSEYFETRIERIVGLMAIVVQIFPHTSLACEP